MSLLLTHIHGLYRVAQNGEQRKSGKEMQDAALLQDAWVQVKDGRIAAIGTMQEGTPAPEEDDTVINCTGRLVLPGFVDSHTHLVFARTREEEYVDRIKGLSYEEIARRGGGILNSARRLREMSEEQLLEDAVQRAWEILYSGTTTVEVKSGYGLTTADELKMLRVARKLSDYCPLQVKTSFLGAHAIPAEYKENREGYINLIIDEMLPLVAKEGLADFMDAFCDEGFFTVQETDRLLKAGAVYGLRPKIHANELANSGGVQVGIANGAISVDHLERTGPREIAALADSNTIPTVLPGVSYFLSIDFAPARDMVDAGLPLCIATDYNPGSSPCGNIPFMLSLACTRMKLLPEEALCAVTLNGAAALDLASECGSIEVGKRADMVITEPMESLARLPYYFARDQVEAVVCGGELYEK